MIAIGPLWFVNLFLLIFFIISTLFIGLTGTRKLTYIQFEKNKINTEKIDEKKIIEFPAIIDRDLLNTIPAIPISEQKPRIQPIAIIEMISVPTPPQDIVIESILEENEEFLPPLQISIRGTIISNNPKENRIFIENNRSKEEKNYMIGDIIEDAQIVFIGRTKAIFVRSNGQQETIYISKASQASEEQVILQSSWDKIIKKKDNGKINIDIGLLIKRIPNIGYFLDDLGIIVHLNNGIPEGCQIGSVFDGSLSSYLGFESGDIIISVNNISTNTQESRIQIYEYLLDQSYEAPVDLNVLILRNSEKITLNYCLFYNIINSNFGKSISDVKVKNNFSVDRSIYKKHAIDEQLSQGQNMENIKQEMNNQSYNLIEKSGKNNAIYREKETLGK